MDNLEGRIVTLSKETKEKVMELYKEGLPKSEISKKCKVSRNKVIEVCKETETQEPKKEIDLQNAGKLTAEAFKLFNTGKKPPEVVIILEQPSRIIMGLYLEWLNINNWLAGIHMMGDFLVNSNCEKCTEELNIVNVFFAVCSDCNWLVIRGSEDQIDKVTSRIENWDRVYVSYCNVDHQDDL